MSALDKLAAIQDGVLAYRLAPQEDVRLKLELKINKLARVVLSSPHLEGREQIMNQLKLARAELLPNLSGYVAGNLQLNLVQSIKPTPICPAYNKIEVPTVSTYHVIGSNIESVRLDGSAINSVPQSLRDRMGDLSRHKVDLFYTAIDGRPFKNIDHVARGPMNLSLHTWAHPHAHPGDDVHQYPETTLLPIMGIQKAPAEQINPRHQDRPRVDPVPFDGLRRFDVHAHLREHAQVRNDEMLYSPDNIHFNLVPGSPFAIFWSGAKLDHRACMTKMLVILDYNDPICQALLNSIRGAPNLLTHLERLQGVVDAIDDYFDPIINGFEQGNAVVAMQQYARLPEMYKKGIHYETWKLHQEPIGVHPDFGRVSFENDLTLVAERHSSNHQRAQALTAFKESLKQTLANSQAEMMTQSLPLARSDCSVTLMKCAREFQKNAAEGMRQFQLLPRELQESVRFAFWELSGAPRVADFGTLRFPGSSKDLKIESLLLAASRQTDAYVPRIIEPVVEEVVPVIVQDNSSPTTPNPLPQDSGTPSVLTPSVETTPLDLSNSPEEDALAQLFSLTGSVEFALGTVEERSATVNRILEPFSHEFHQRVYFNFYNGYRLAHPDEQGVGIGDNWGGRNIGKDIEVCIEAFMQAQGQ
ncbi:MAG: hypothetical protein JSR39_09115 [Verrucomicrobia bacterium]|nr:hypothetical protein [Verrucomicrobiota bacterium]